MVECMGFEATEGLRTRTRGEKGPKQVRNTESFIHTIQSLLMMTATINNVIGTFGDNDFVICGSFGNIDDAGKNELRR